MSPRSRASCIAQRYLDNRPHSGRSWLAMRISISHRPRSRWLLVAVAALLVAACSTAGGAGTTSPNHVTAGSGPSTGGSLTVYAASSLTAAFKDLGAAYTAATGTQVSLSFDASSALEAQIEQGAPADILAS